MLETIVVDDDALQSDLYRRGWTDGLPILAPTVEAVRAFLDAAGVGEDDVVGGLADRGLTMTAGTAAANAVMAGCEPVHLPIVLAALGAALDPSFNAPVVCTSTGGAAICVIVSGPGSVTAGMNSAHNALGGGNRANATIGRAVRLALMNLLGVKAHGTDGTSLGHPGKITFCFAESPPPAPWEPLGVALGYDPSDTVVTVAPADAPRQIANHLNEDPEGILATIAAAVRSPWHFPVGKGGVEVVVVLGPEHAQFLAGGGLTRRHVQEYLVGHTRVSEAELAAAGVLPERGSHHDMVPDADGRYVTVARPEDVRVVTAGGAGAGWSAVIPSWAPAKHARAVTRRVRPPGEGLPPCGPDGCTVNWD